MRIHTFGLIMFAAIIAFINNIKAERIDEEKLRESALIWTKNIRDKRFFKNGLIRKTNSIRGYRWQSQDITYKIKNYPASLEQSKVDKVIKEAFGIWEEATELKFTRIYNNDLKAKIEISFESGKHGDGLAFDGTNLGGDNILAHSMFPESGNIHFDTDELWIDRKSRNFYDGSDLLRVSIHEIGHSLGLSHSQNEESIMYRFYRFGDYENKLSYEDIAEIREMYGYNSGKSKHCCEHTNINLLILLLFYIFYNFYNNFY